VSYRVNKLDNEPIVVFSVDAAHSIRNEGLVAGEVITQTLDNQTEHVYLIMELTHLSMDLEDLMFGANVATRQLQLLKHPKIRETLIVTQSGLAAMGAKGMNSPIFGNIKVKTFKTLDEALAYARVNR
jgi:hypothetical protein